MAEYKEKFIVINKKHIATICSAVVRAEIEEHLRAVLAYMPNNKYYVCNQDELYAQRVIETILEGEREKEALEENNEL